ncbi:MAG TPA: hypothetical protein VGR35_09595 [Tepidisphaeraceae bacterium]|nr:hypothetical protein [Tepidisphaeraceae bacterium]
MIDAAFLDWVTEKAAEYADTGRPSVLAEIGTKVEQQWDETVRTMVEALVRLLRDGKIELKLVNQLLRSQMEKPTYKFDKVDAAEGTNFGPDYSEGKQIDGKGPERTN